MFLPKQFINYRSNEYCINVNGDKHIFEYEIFNTKNINKCFSGKMFLIIKNRKTFENQNMKIMPKYTKYEAHTCTLGIQIY